MSDKTGKELDSNKPVVSQAIDVLNSPTTMTFSEIQNSEKYHQEQERSKINADYVRAMFFFSRFFNGFIYLGYEAMKSAEGEFNIINFNKNINIVRSHPILGCLYTSVLENYLTSIFSLKNVDSKSRLQEKNQLFSNMQNNLLEQVNKNNIILNNSEINSKLREFKVEMEEQRKIVSAKNFCIAETDTKVMNHRLWLLEEFLLFSLKEMGAREWLIIGNHLRNILLLSINKKGLATDEIMNTPIFKTFNSNDEERLNTSFDNLISAIIQVDNDLRKKAIKEYTDEVNNLAEQKQIEPSSIKSTIMQKLEDNINSTEHRDKLKSEIYKYMIGLNDPILSVDSSKDDKSLKSILDEIALKDSVKGNEWKSVIISGFYKEIELQPSLIYR